MAKQYKGSLSLDWYNKQKAILLKKEEETKSHTDIPAPKINWVNKEEALFYEINEEEGRGVAPYWVDRNDIRVKEARPLIFQKAYKAIPKDIDGSLPGLATEYMVQEINQDDPNIDNLLIKGDNLLALNTLKKIFDNKPEEEKVKCIYIDPPYNTGQAFDRYDDNMEHSEWLTMMRDRIVILYSILREDGCIFIHLDDKEIAYTRILLDEIFGRGNYINTITVEANSPSGFRHTSSDLFKSSNYILLFAKNKEQFNLKKTYIEKEYDKAYKFVFDDISIPDVEWKWKNINDVVALELGYENSKIARNSLGDQFDVEISLYAIENADRVFRTASVTGGAYLKRKVTVDKSKSIKDRIIHHPNDDMDYKFIGGEMVVSYSDRLNNIDGIKLPAKVITDLWNDIAWEGIAKEGGVDFPRSKKPEKLIHRLLDMVSTENDLILDCFSGSGTTISVAHKMQRKWIGIELGSHCDDLIINRVKNILNGTDNSGISKYLDVNWQGGGSFKYYHLGESIIKLNEDGTGDFNWSLGKEFLQESFLSSYDYIIDNAIDFNEGELFIDKKNQPIVGVQTVGTKKRIAVITLNEPNGILTTLSYDEMQSIYKTIKKKFSPEYINIFTNRGVEIAYDSKPDDLEVIKIPNAIFAELEK